MRDLSARVLTLSTVAAYQALVLEAASLGALTLIRRWIEACEATGVDILAPPRSGAVRCRGLCGRSDSRGDTQGSRSSRSAKKRTLLLPLIPAASPTREAPYSQATMSDLTALIATRNPSPFGCWPRFKQGTAQLCKQRCVILDVQACVRHRREWRRPDRHAPTRIVDVPRDNMPVKVRYDIAERLHIDVIGTHRCNNRLLRSVEV
jgi:hypothetical protein